MITTRLAIPKLGESVAPRFESAELFSIFEIEDGVITNTEVVRCRGCEGFGSVRILRDNNVDVLICNGIKNFYRDMLESLEIHIITTISLAVDEAVREFLTGRLTTTAVDMTAETGTCQIPHDDLVCWARDLYESNGYVIDRPEKEDPFPIDLVGVIDCPVCGRQIKVAICCGAKLYRSDQEIREFHHSLAEDYQAAVYVCSGDSSIEERCRSYGIQFIDPAIETYDDGRLESAPIPLLPAPVAGHEAAYGKDDSC